MIRYLHSLYCDDIRHETNGKVSYVGVYHGKLLVPSVPVVVPKLCVAIFAVTSANEPFKKFSLKILKNDEKLVEQEISSEQLNQTSDVSGSTTNDKQDRIQVLNFLFQFSPFPIESNMKLRVRADTDKGELKAPGLIVEQVPPT